LHRFGILALSLLAVMLSACSHKTTITTANGTETVTTSGDSKTTTISGKDGNVTIGQNAVDPSKLGLPVYPGSQQVGSMSGTSAHGSGQVVSMKTADSFDKVSAWYKSQLPSGAQQMSSTAGGNSFAEFMVTDRGAMIMVTGKPNETDIVITVATTPAPAST
jgi:tetrahydromethanopterin S-methyltransferase subunit B